MSRSKKSRKTGAFMTVLERKPKKQELLADPTSKESRRKKLKEQRKKQKSVFEKAQATQKAAERDAQAGRRGTRHGGPLAEKIRKLNAEKKAQQAQDNEE
ncbi:hypothetical protein H9C73_08180 [Marinobacterium sp. AK62]|uniref:Uncharacterized protein n=1 Tax=Marinobacterium alkalitolerans TaxID=1542925 RepID=A0ABS3ZAI6_9GAMM|nr:hypothetical protein [Marinobacterium alkalitolerans]MBP0048713.1 hypothetical protein [Marinobacterium alkalitolerans]